MVHFNLSLWFLSINLSSHKTEQAAVSTISKTQQEWQTQKPLSFLHCELVPEVASQSHNTIPAFQA